jgi:hypothetical protein
LNKYQWTKIKLRLDIKNESQHVIQNVILPAVNDISKHTFTEPEKAIDIIKRVMDDPRY